MEKRRVYVDTIDAAVYAAARLVCTPEFERDPDLAKCQHTAYRSALVGLSVLYVESKADLGDEELSESESILYECINRAERKYPGTLYYMSTKTMRYFETVSKTKALSRVLRRDERLLLLIAGEYKAMQKGMEEKPFRCYPPKKEG